MSRIVKICPSCGKENDRTKLICKCTCDISGVPEITIDDTPTGESNNSNKSEAPLSKGMEHSDPKKCLRCGATILPGAINCIGCGEPVAHDLLSSRNEAADPFANQPLPSVARKLMIVVGDRQFECQDGDVLGREGTVASQIFSDIPTVSRRHVSVQLRSGEWWLTNLQTSNNSTIVNGVELPRGEAIRLSADTTLQISSRCHIKLIIV